MTTSEVRRLRQHISTRIADSKLCMNPFPHIVCKDVFPFDYYQMLLSSNPFDLEQDRASPWVSKEDSRFRTTTTPYYLRNQIALLGQPRLFLASDPWNLFSETFKEVQWFFETILQCWTDYFAIRFGSLIQEDDFSSLLDFECFLQRHDSGFFLGPHTDLPTRVFTAIFSLAEEDHPLIGTNLLVNSDRLVRCWGDKHHDEKDFTVVANTGYFRNQLFIFFKTRHSFHSVPMMNESALPKNGRLGLQIQCYEPKNGLFRDLSRPDLFQNRHLRTNSNPSFNH